MIGRILRISIFTLFLLTKVIYGIEFNATVDKKEISIDETVKLTISISGNISSVPDLALRNLQDFDVVSQSQSQSFNFVNGRFSMQYQKVFVLLPKRVGRLTIPSFKLKAGRQTFSTSPIEIVVKKSGSGTKSQSRAKKVKNVFVEATLAKKEVFLGEPVELTFSYYRRINVLDINFDPPEFSGLYSKLVQKSGEKYATIDGVRYLTQSFKYVVVPLNTGNISIGRGRFVFSIDFFNPPSTLYTAPLKLKVNPLPPIDSKKFTGSVGTYNVEIKLNRSVISDTETVQLTYRIYGEGSVRFINEPNINIENDFRIFDSQVTEKQTYKNGKLYSEKNFTYLLIPKHLGTITIGPFEYQYFDPKQRRYVTKKTNRVMLKVRGRMIGKRESEIKPVISSKEENIQYIFIDVPRMKEINLRKVLLIEFLLFLLINIIVVTLRMGLISRIFSISDVQRETLKSLEQLKKEKRINEFLSGLEKVVKRYLQKKYGLSVFDENNLKRAGLENFIEIFERINDMRYGGLQNEVDRTNLIEMAKRVIQ